VSFCLQGRPRLFDFWFLPLKINLLKNQKAMCRKCVGTKSMTEKITEGLARGRAKKTGGVLINTFKNQSISFIKTAGFFDLWGGLDVGLIAKDGVC
jgi:hypothetical protein